MSLDQPPQNRMMIAPPAKKGFHFASDGLYFAEFVEAETAAEAEAIYQKVKRLMSPAAGSAPAEMSDPASSTPPAPETPAEAGVQ
jgi:hypothetical protein